MSHTIRKEPYNDYDLRHPHTFSEKKQLSNILSNQDVGDYPLSKFNRIKSKENNEVLDHLSTSHYQNL